LADEIERRAPDLEALKARRRGRPSLGSGPADVVPVRLDPELKAAVEGRAAREHTSTSEIIRKALRNYLDVA
jgi:Ribbon-helix-helix protein, copG family